MRTCVRWAATFSFAGALLVLACSSDKTGQGVSQQQNSDSECEKNGAKCYANAGGCPGATVPQQWSCPQEITATNPNKCCAPPPPDAGGQ